jgi:hypothetical protein
MMSAGSEPLGSVKAVGEMGEVLLLLLLLLLLLPAVLLQSHPVKSIQQSIELVVRLLLVLSRGSRLCWCKLVSGVC